MSEILTGRIKYANSKGFGFIETEKQIDFYFHYTQFHDGDREKWKEMLGTYVKGGVSVVTFEVDQEAVEPRAVRVVITDVLTKENGK